MSKSITSIEPANTKRILDALNAVISSETFAGANRFQAFLTYIVMETLENRGSLIRAKRIATDVYGRTGDLIPEQETQVRVDAGRLRRRLSQYYADEGSQQHIQIFIKPGGYVPTFNELPSEIVGSPPTLPVAATNRFPSWLVPAILAILVGAVIFYIIAYETKVVSTDDGWKPLDISESVKEVERLAVMRKSPTALQAYSLVEEARELTYPPLAASRIIAAIEMCKQAIDLDPSSYRGYSCTARAVGFQAFTSYDSPKRDKLVAYAWKMANKAVSIDPTNPHAQSARAWILFVRREYDVAKTLALHSVTMAPRDYYVRNYYGMIAGFNGDYQEVIDKVALPGISAKLEDLYHPLLLAGSKFHTGSYQEAIDHIEFAAKKTGKISTLLTSILAAAYQGIGNDVRAAELVKELQEVWPGKRLESKLQNLYRHKKNIAQIVDRIYAINPEYLDTN